MTEQPSHPFTYEASKDVKLTSLRDAFEAAFAIRGLATEIAMYVSSTAEAGDPDLRVLRTDATKKLDVVWQNARDATYAISDLIDAIHAKREEA